ncbi:cytochrome b/b6 domain-containing protein [Shewanella youngdeokensis]|uniref:Cytochrome b/b6 domain-containing protein n=1 Tax=Shewanella youngdeokensis TaxID=2999068 RepID=A0ABZ0K241_9GAMM|nr:cytochrome b/b6 domain-containing protein [Shewanella sp. DAU334]
MAKSKLKTWLDRYIAQQHIVVIFTVAYLIMTSGFVLIGRSLRANATFWDLSHVYLGLLTALLAVVFLITTCLKGKWRQYFPWLIADFSQLSKDIKGLAKGKLPVAGGRGLFSIVEGLGLLVFVAVGVTGCLWYLTQGTADALQWRGYHIDCAKVFIGFIGVHVVFACSHVLDFIRN